MMMKYPVSGKGEVVNIYDKSYCSLHSEKFFFQHLII